MNISGLHSCKPGNEPQIGQIKTFTVIHYPANGGKKAWTKIKSASADQGGTPYKITAVKPTGYTDSYGNVSFNIDIEPANGSSTQREASPTSHVASKGDWDDRSSRIERQHSQEMSLRYLDLMPHLTKNATPKDMTEMLREMTDWFQRDVGHVPGNETAAKAPTKSELAADPDDEEIPF